MSDFFDVEQDDLEVPEVLTFIGNEAVEFLILSDIVQNDDKGYIKLPCRVLTGEHRNKVHELYIRRKDKKTFSKFLKTFWTVDDLLKKKASPSHLVDRKFRAVPSVPREYNGKLYQDLNNWQDLGAELVKVPTEEGGSIPF